MPIDKLLKLNTIKIIFMARRSTNGELSAELIGIKNCPNNGWSSFRGALVRQAEGMVVARVVEMSRVVSQFKD